MNSTTKTLEQLAEDVKLARYLLAQQKALYLRGSITYDQLAQSGKEVSAALYEYSKAKFPNAKAKRLPYQAIIR